MKLSKSFVMFTGKKGKEIREKGKEREEKEERQGIRKLSEIFTI